MRKKKIYPFDIFNYALLILFAIVTLYPFWYVIIGSVTNGLVYELGGVWLLPKNFTTANFSVVLHDDRLWVAFRNTIVRTVFGTAVALLFTSMVAYAMSRKELRHRKVFRAVNMFTMFFSGGIVPFYMLVNWIGLYNNFLVYILPMSYSVYNMIVMSSFFGNIPEELRESAVMDGAGEFRVWLQIYMPLSKAVLATVGLWVAVGHWNAYMATLLYTNKDSLITLQYYLMRVIKDASMPDGIDGAIAGEITSKTVSYAAIVVAPVPIICVYPLIQKQFAKGVLVGSVKG